LQGVDGRLGTLAADCAVKIAMSDQHLVFTSYTVDAIPVETVLWWREDGVETIVTTANCDDVDSLRKFMEGAEAVSFVSTWLLGETRRRQHKNVIDTSVLLPIAPRICYTSFVSAGLPGPKFSLPFLSQVYNYTESLIFASNLTYNIQRNYLYADNIPHLFAPSWKLYGDTWPLNLNGVAGAYVARSDCAHVCVALLLGRGIPNTVPNVSGPESITDVEIMSYIYIKTGYSAQIIPMTDAELDAYWVAKGLPRTVFGDFEKLQMKLCVDDLTSCREVVRRGLMGEVTDTVEVLTEEKAKGWREVVNGYEGILPRP
ncbi:hypothetical protein B0J14DRAFT_486490, partial [Halenospora varia]